MAHQHVVAGRYTVLSEAKRGGTARIFKAFDLEAHQIVALKVFSNSVGDPAVMAEIWSRECAALQVLSHDNVVRLIDAGRDPESSERYIVLEWIDGQTLEAALSEVGPLSWEAFQERFGRQLLDALLFAAEKNIAHRDLSPGNVLVQPSGLVKVIDWGQAKLDSVGIGLTVKDWKTVPYCLPEDDSGRYTQTRDPFCFAALAVRALHGQPLANHEALYAAFARVEIPVAVHAAMTKALSRIPEDRYPNVVEFARGLEDGETGGRSPTNRLQVALRFSPAAIELLAGLITNDSDDPSSVIVAELNELVAVAPAGAPNNPKIDLETTSFRLTAMPGREGDHLVVDRAAKKLFRLDNMYRSDHWLAQAEFTTVLPVRQSDRDDARRNLGQFYRGLEAHLNDLAALKGKRTVGVYDEWGRLLDALRYLAQNSVPPLRYTNLELDGSRVVAKLENPEDASEQELRVISSGNRWLFRGEVEVVRGDKCILMPTRQSVDLDSLPSRGSLEIDWAQTKVAIDRQARALERFRSGDIPSPILGAMLTGEEKGAAEPSFAKLSQFFDDRLDQAKKVIVSRVCAGEPLMVIHGPPGTGKTKLIVEIIRQELAANPESKILLASQTHAALDNALERLLKSDSEIPCVRIGSGSKEADVRVAATSIAERSRQLRDSVAHASREYIQSRALEMGVDKKEVELGLAVLDLLGTKEVLERVQASLHQGMNEAEALAREIAAEGAETRARNEQLARARALEDELEDLRGEEIIAHAGVEAARRKLVAIGKDGKELASHGASELKEWADVLLSDGDRRAVGELMRLAEEWKSRFDQSDDFKVAIISSSSVVAGTCVGFCREEASLRTTFDLCIVDEAGKATTAELLVPLAQARRAVLLGDHHQLPAVLDHQVKSREIADRFALNPRQLEVQLFEQLITALGEGAKADLTEQHRMRGAIGRLVSECFYKGKLSEGDSLALRQLPPLTLAGLDAEVTWLDPYSGAAENDVESAKGFSFENARESQAVIALLKRISFALQAQKSAWKPAIGVVSGYAPQVSRLRNEIRREKTLDHLSVECASVHAFQGREVDICIYAVTRKNSSGNIGMLSDWRHLNVALSRAQNYLVIVGSVEFCKSIKGDNPFRGVIEFAEKDSGCVIKEWSDA